MNEREWMGHKLSIYIYNDDDDFNNKRRKSLIVLF